MRMGIRTSCLAESLQEPGLLFRRSGGHAPVALSQSVMRLPQWECPPTASSQPPGTQPYESPGSVPDEFGLCQYILSRHLHPRWWQYVGWSPRRPRGLFTRTARAGAEAAYIASAPNGAKGCSHGWSGAAAACPPWRAAARRGTRGERISLPQHLLAPTGRRRFWGRRKDACARRFLRPLGAGVLKHERFHGFRTARLAAAGASPVATIRRPVGAKNGSYKVCSPVVSWRLCVRSPTLLFRNKLSTSAHAHYHMSNSIKFESKSIKKATFSVKKASKKRAFRHAHLNIWGGHPLWR